MPPSKMVLRDTSEPSARDYGEQSLQSREVQAPNTYPVPSHKRRRCLYWHFAFIITSSKAKKTKRLLITFCVDGLKLVIQTAGSNMGFSGQYLKV